MQQKSVSRPWDMPRLHERWPSPFKSGPVCSWRIDVCTWDSLGNREDEDRWDRELEKYFKRTAQRRAAIHAHISEALQYACMQYTPRSVKGIKLFSVTEPLIWQGSRGALFIAPGNSNSKKREAWMLEPEVGSRSAEETRSEKRARLSSFAPPGPLQGGPDVWQGQRFREGSGRWANNGGKYKDMYKMYYAKKQQGLWGREPAYWHPMSNDGFWASKAAEEGRLAPWQERERAAGVR